MILHFWISGNEREYLTSISGDKNCNSSQFFVTFFDGSVTLTYIRADATRSETYVEDKLHDK